MNCIYTCYAVVGTHDCGHLMKVVEESGTCSEAAVMSAHMCALGEMEIHAYAMEKEEIGGCMGGTCT